MAVSGLTAGLWVALELEFISHGCVFFYVAAVAVIANRIGLMAALVATLAAMPQINYFVIAPRDAFTVPTMVELSAYVCMIGVALMVTPNLRLRSRKRTWDAGTELPFTHRDRSPEGAQASMHGMGVRFWSVTSTGKWSEDVAVGEEYARIYLARATTGELRPPMAWIVADMIKAGRFSGVEAGFLQGVCRVVLPNH